MYTYQAILMVGKYFPNHADAMVSSINTGAKQIGNTQFLVTSGYGFGAVPFRLGTRSEIWVITLQSVTEQSATK